ncbi:MAG: barrel protein [Acidobacteria bacterium]|nr:barrel protein [Acidobacteriota bacterium]
MNRKQFISTIAGAAASTVIGANAAMSSAAAASSQEAPKHKVKRGVSLYSYQWALMEKGWNLEDCLEEAGDIGAYGIEFMLHAMKSEYPNVSNKWIDNWWAMMDKFGTIPVCYTHFGDFYRQRDGIMSLDDSVEYATWNFKLAKQLGLTKVRGFGRHDAMERLIPVAEKLGMWIGQEIHAPATLQNNKMNDKVLKLAQKYPDTVGFVPDMGIFQKYPRPLNREIQIREGKLTRDTALYIEDAYKKGTDKAAVAEKLKGMNPKPGDTAYVDTVFRAGDALQNPKDLIPLIPYCKHIHGKCWEMTPGNEFDDTSILYKDVVPVLMANGFDGYICTEFEGQRMGTILDIDEIDQVRRHQVMLKRLLGV